MVRPGGGLNGAGKTTLFIAIAGLVLHGAGSIHFEDGTLAGQIAAAIVKRGILQCLETCELFGELTVGENLGIAGSHLDKAKRKVDPQWLFDPFQILAIRWARNAGTSSGGEQQRLATTRCFTPGRRRPTEQNVTVALPHADRMYVLELARLVWEGEPARFAAEAGRISRRLGGVALAGLARVGWIE